VPAPVKKIFKGNDLSPSGPRIFTLLIKQPSLGCLWLTVKHYTQIASDSRYVSNCNRAKLGGPLEQ
jgi:hypothetical protein